MDDLSEVNSRLRELWWEEPPIETDGDGLGVLFRATSALATKIGTERRAGQRRDPSLDYESNAPYRRMTPDRRKAHWPVGSADPVTPRPSPWSWPEPPRTSPPLPKSSEPFGIRWAPLRRSCGCVNRSAIRCLQEMPGSGIFECVCPCHLNRRREDREEEGG